MEGWKSENCHFVSRFLISFAFPFFFRFFDSVFLFLGENFFNFFFFNRGRKKMLCYDA
jgi:hypothetical protein